MQATAWVESYCARVRELHSNPPVSPEFLEEWRHIVEELAPQCFEE